jgi:hypothetical protein
MAQIPVVLGLGGVLGYFIGEKTQPKYDILETRNPDNLSLQTRKVIDLITIQEGINPVGSQKFKIQKYPSDIDVFEKYQTCCNLQTATKDVAQRLETIAKQLKKTTDVYFGDFKAGLDSRYDVDLGDIDYLKHEIRNFDRPLITEQLSALLTSGLLTNSEYIEMIYLVNQPLKFQTYEQLKEMIKDKKTVRWTLNELIKGEKTLVGGKKLTLEEAITQKTAVKIDVWSKVQSNRFVEVTNFFLFIYIDEKGEEHVMNLELGDLIESFMKDIILYSTEEHKKSMKVAKRIWQLSTYLNYQEMLNKLYPLFQSDIGLLNQIASDIDVLKMMLVKLPNPPLQDMITEIDEFKSRLSTFQEVKLDENLIYLIIDSITENYQKYGNNVDKNFIIDNLSYLEEYFLNIVENYASSYLKENDINREQLVKYIETHKLGKM